LKIQNDFVFYKYQVPSWYHKVLVFPSLLETSTTLPGQNKSLDQFEQFVFNIITYNMDSKFDPLIDILYGEGDSQSIKQPKPLRMVLCDSEAFIAQSHEWQLGILVQLDAALKSACDVARFLLMEEGYTNSKILEELCFSLLGIYENVAEEAIISSVLKILSTVLSAGAPLSTIKYIFTKAAQAHNTSNYKMELHMLQVVYHALIPGNHCRLREWEHAICVSSSVALLGIPKTVRVKEAEKGPICFINIGGVDNGMDLGVVSKWPFPKEYCLWMWIRVEEGGGKYGIFSLQTDAGKGIVVSLVGDSIIGYSIQIESLDERNQAAVVRVGLPKDKFVSRNWHQITIYHFTRFIGSSQVRIWIDNFETKSNSLAFPNKMVSHELFHMKAFTDFDGQIASFFIFNELINPSTSSAILTAHYNMETNSQSAEKQLGHVPGTGLILGIVDKTLDSKTFLHLYPPCSFQNTCIDLYGNHHGALLGTSSGIWNFPKLKNLLSGIGGVSSIIPFIWDRKLQGETDDLCAGACLVQMISLLAHFLADHPANQLDFFSVNGPALIACALERIPRGVLANASSDFLFGAVEDEEDFEFDSPFFASLLSLFSSVSSWPQIVYQQENSDINLYTRSEYNSLEKLLDTWLFCNMPLLGRCYSVDGRWTAVQAQWFEFLQCRAYNSPRLFYDQVGIQRLMDSLRGMYQHLFASNETNDSDKAGLTEQISIEATKLAVLMLNDVCDTGDVFVLLNACIGAGHGSTSISISETSHFDSLVGLLFWTKNKSKWSLVDVLLARDGLRILACLLRRSKSPKGFYEACSRVDGNNGLANVLAVNVVQCQDVGEELRATALRCISIYLSRVEFEVTYFDPSSSGYFFASKSSNPHPLAVNLSKGFQHFAATSGFSVIANALLEIGNEEQTAWHLNQTYSALLEMALDCNASQHKRRTTESSTGSYKIKQRRESEATIESVRSSGFTDIVDLNKDLFTKDFIIVLDDSQLIRNSYALWVILQLLPSMGLYLQQRVCQDLFLLLKFKQANRIAFSAVPGWQGNLLTFMGSLGESESTQVCFDMGMKLCVLVLENLILTSSKGWSEIEILMSIAPVTSNGRAIVSAIFAQCFTDIKTSIQHIDELGTLFSNMRKIVILVDMMLPMIEPDTVTAVISVVDELCNHHRCLDQIDDELNPVLRQFCWSVELGSQDELDRIRGPTALALLNLSLVSNTGEFNDRDAERIISVLGFIRKMPPFKTLISWRPQQHVNTAKGEKTALVVKLLMTVHSTLSCNSGDHNLNARAILIAIYDLYLDLLQLILPPYAIAEYRSILEKDDWMEEQFFKTNLLDHSNSNSFGVGGALIALKESASGFDKFIEQRMRDLWEQYKSDSRGKSKMDCFDFEQRLSYAELNRLSSLSTSQNEEESNLLQSWLTMTTVNETSIWFPGGQDTKWMVSLRECSSRRRLLLSKNNHFNKHIDATYRDNAKTVVAIPDVQLITMQIKRNAEEESDKKSLEYWRWLGGRFESEPDMKWFIYNGGRTGARSKTLSRRVTYVEEPQLIKSLPSKRSMLDELDTWTQKNSSGNIRQYTLGKNESLVYVGSNCQWVTPLQILSGRIEVSNSNIYFYATDEKKETDEFEDDWILQSGKPMKRTPRIWGGVFDKEMMRWSIESLFEIHGRRYLLRETALEIFFTDMTTIFLCFPSVRARADCLNYIMKQQTPNLERTFAGCLEPKAVFHKSKIAERWQKREISNFEYLMKLNTIAGRSYNDINQYPVFPWVLSDYTSDTIDLKNPHVYRDLSKPIGALNPARLREFLERYENFTDASMDIPAFHYGSHYSNAGIVMHYLLRMEPFTTMGVDLQGGRFDCPDRLFFSIEDCWLGSMESVTDVKELIPEFFFCPEMFLNSNEFDLGVRQGRPIGDVVLPPWANGSAHEFIRIQREALESEYVSQNLHHWIDLIFGFKQRGREAEKACNIFYYLTYEGAVDLDSILDPSQRHSIETQIAHFGQTPSQLLKKPHCQRYSLEKISDIKKDLPALSSLQVYMRESGVTAQPANVISRILSAGAFTTGKPLEEFPKASIAYISAYSDRIIVVHQDLFVGVHKYSQSEVGGYINLKFGPAKQLLGFSKSVTAVGMRLNSQTFVYSRQNKLIVSCNYWDGSIRAQNIEGKTESVLVAHVDRVVCVGICEREHVIVAGSRDNTISVWHVGGGVDLRDEILELFGKPESASSTHQQALVLVSKVHGHVSPVTAISVSSMIGIIASGSDTGVILIHTLHDGAFLRQLSSNLDGPVSLIQIARITGNVILYSKDSKRLSVFSVNGALLSTVLLSMVIKSIMVEYVNHAESEFVLLGLEGGVLQIRATNTLEVINSIQVPEEDSDQVAITCIAMSPCLKYIFAGTSSGKIVIMESV